MADNRRIDPSKFIRKACKATKTKLFIMKASVKGFRCNWNCNDEKFHKSLCFNYTFSWSVTDCIKPKFHNDTSCNSSLPNTWMLVATSAGSLVWTPPAVLALVWTTLCLPRGAFSDVVGRTPPRWRTWEVQRKHLLALLAVEVQMASGANERWNGQVERWGCKQEAAGWEAWGSLRHDGVDAVWWPS